MKKSFILIITIILLCILFKFYYTSCKCKNLNYAIERYTTTGFFNENKLYSLEKYTILFSDEEVAIVEVTGLNNSRPIKTIKYKLLLEKNRKGIWKSKKYYNVHI